MSNVAKVYTKWRRNIAENFNRLSRVHERYIQTTKGRQQVSSRSLKSTERNVKRGVQSTTTVLRSFVRHYPGEPVPEETLIHPPSWSSCNLHQLLPSTTIHSIPLFKPRAWQSFCTTSFHVPPVHLPVWLV